MIYKFRIVSDEAENFKREIEIDSEASFLDFRNAICESVKFDKEQMCSFFICEDGWEKGKEITLEDMGSDSSEDVYLMDESALEDFVEDEGQRLIFVFDYLTERAFFIELKKTVPGKRLDHAVCTASVGNPPDQYVDFDDFNAKIDAKAAAAATADIEEDFYGTTEFNEDEFDAAGYDELTFD